MKPIKRIVAVKDQMFADLDQIKRSNQSATELLSQAVASKGDELKSDVCELRNALKELSEVGNEQAGKLNWQLVSSANTLKEIRELLYEYCLPTQDPYSYNAGAGAYRLNNPELALLQYLRAFLPTRNAIEIGANSGRATELLLSAGYRVYAFEANNSICETLCSRFESNPDFKGFALAIGTLDGTAQLQQIKTSQGAAQIFEHDLTSYGTTVQHSLPEGVYFSDSREVAMRSLQSLHQSRQLPLEAAVVLIDCEGGELDVIRGMGKTTYACVVTKYWDERHHFSGGIVGLLGDTVAEMRRRGYGWHIVIYRLFDGEHSSDARFYTNIDQSVEDSFGFALFFRDFALFTEAMKWCTANMRQNETFR